MAMIKARDEALIAKAGKPEVKEAFDFIAAENEKFTAEHKDSPLGEIYAGMQKLTGKTLADAKATINDARFEAYGAANYPDATFTLRLTYGTVKGYEAGTTKVAPKTTVHGLYERNAAFDNEHPFDLPKQWLDAKGKLDWNTPYNFVCTTDIIGGNSGSPILDRDANVVGLVFDGNIESLPGNYWFDEEVNRTVGVHTGIIVESLAVVYEEKGLVKELMGTK
jgi:hypothetical protein